MGVPYNGWATRIALQQETSFGAASLATIYALPGNIGFTLQPALDKGQARTTLWRQTGETTFSARYWKGTFICELGLHQVSKILCDVFLEAVGTSDAGGGLTRYDYRPRRTSAMGSLKLGIELEDNSGHALHGVVVDALTVDLRVNNIVRLQVDFKAKRRADANAPALGSAGTVITTPPLTTLTASVVLNGTNQAALTQFTSKWTEEKTAVRFGEDRQPTGFAGGGMFVTGEAAEYYGPYSLIPPLVETLTPASLALVLSDPSVSGRQLILTYPNLIFDAGFPDMVSKADLPYRATFKAQTPSTLDLAAETKLSLVF